MANEGWKPDREGTLGPCVTIADASDRTAVTAVDFRPDSVGRRKAFQYDQLIWLDYEPDDTSERVRLHFSSHTVTIHGRRLEPLYEAFLRREVTAVSVRDERFVTEETDEPMVTRIVPQQTGSQPPGPIPYEFTGDGGGA